MSSDDQAYDDLSDREDLMKSFKIVGVVLSFLLIMAVLRITCNLFIDIAILQDRNSMWRTLCEVRRIYCPWWHPRTQPQEEPSASANDTSTEMINMNRLLTGLTPQGKRELLISILHCRIATEEDLDELKNQSDESSKPHDDDDISCEDIERPSIHDGVVICPICIHDIEVGNSIVSLAACSHVFHCDCLVEWLGNHNRDCPYCRSVIVTQEMLNEAHRERMRRATASASAEPRT